MAILSAADHAFWEENGYVVVHNVVPQQNLDAVIDVMWEFLGMDPSDPTTWYTRPGWHSQTGMVELYQHQALWDNRQYPRVHEIFSELFGTEKLWVSLDRVNMNPPARPDWDYQGFIHWDFDPETWPIGLRSPPLYSLSSPRRRDDATRRRFVGLGWHTLLAAHQNLMRNNKMEHLA